MSAFESFMTGLLTQTSETISKRKEKAEDYFEMQMEKASTIGATSLKERREAHRQITNVSNNLIQQANMPEDVVRGLANDGPEALNQAYKIYSQSVENGIEVNEDFWRDVYEFSSEISTDQPLSEFLAQASGLYPANLQATAKEGGDPFSAFVSSGLGLNAMERARTRLETTEVEGGYSARDLLNMANGTQSGRPLGDVSYTLDLQAIQDRENEAKNKNSGVPDPLDPDDRIRITTTFNEQVDKAVEEEIKRRHVNGEEATREDVLPQVLEDQSVTWLRSAGINNLGWIKENLPAVYEALPEEIRNAYEKGEIDTLPEETEIEEGPSIPEVPEVTTSPLDENDEPITPVPAPNPQSKMIKPGEEIPKLRDGDEILTFKEQLPDGTVIYQYPNGELTPPMDIDRIPEEAFVYDDMPNTIPAPSGNTRPEQDPPQTLKVGDRTLVFQGYQQDSDSWAYVNSSDGKMVLIPVKR